MNYQKFAGTVFALLIIIVLPSIAIAGTSVLVVLGTAKDDKGNSLGSGLQVQVTNNNRKDMTVTEKTDANGKYVVTLAFAEPGEKLIVAEVGENISIRVFDTTNKLLATGSHKLTDEDLRISNVTIDAFPPKIQLSIQPTKLFVDGNNIATIKISVIDAEDYILSDVEITLSLSPKNGSLNLDKGMGSFTAIYTAGNDPGIVTVTATVGNIIKTEKIELILPSLPPDTKAEYNDKWHKEDFTITLIAEDKSGSGVKSTNYKINDGIVKTVSKDGQPKIDREGSNNKLEYWSIDNAGNEEPHHTITDIKLDKTGPVLSEWTLDPMDLTAIYQGMFRVKVKATDSGGSGILGDALIDYHIANDNSYDGYESMVSEGNNLWHFDIKLGWKALAGKTLYYKVQVSDVAGNASNEERSELIDSKKPPTVNIINKYKLWERNTLTIEAKAIDTDGYIDDVLFQYSLDKEKWYDIGLITISPYTIQWDTKSAIKTVDNTVWIKATATDNDGLKGDAIIDQSFGIDNEQPTTTTSYDGKWHKEDFTIALTAEDKSGSGIKSTNYRINDGVEKIVSKDRQPKIDREGSANKLEYWSIDNAGNEEPHHTITDIRLDETVPIISEWALEPSNLNSATAGIFRIKIKVTDNISGFKTPQIAYHISSSYGDYKIMQLGDEYWYFDISEHWINYPDKILYFKVKVEDNAGNIIENEKQEKIENAPKPPTGLVGEVVNASVKLSWKVNVEKDIMGYNVYRGLSEDEIDTKINPALINAIAYEDKLPEYNKTYWYSITAVNVGSVESERSIAVKVLVPNVNIGRVIIMLGGGDSKNNKFYSTFDSVAQHIYYAFKKRRFTDDDIYYLNPEKAGRNYIDSSTTLENLKDAVTEWAPSRTESQKLSLYIYMISHNGSNGLTVNKEKGVNEFLTKEDLNKWLIESKLDDIFNITIIIEACSSGTFISALSEQGRIIITSSQENVDSTILLDYSFGTIFFDKIVENLNVLESFKLASKEVLADKTFDRQQPQLEANGDGKANNFDDEVKAESKYIDGDYNSMTIVPLAVPPEIVELTSDRELPAEVSEMHIQAKISSVNKVKRVWASIVPPDYIGSLPWPEYTIPDLATTELMLVGDNKYEGILDGLDREGVYTIFVYAEDEFGSISSPGLIKITVTMPPSDVDPKDKLAVSWGSLKDRIPNSALGQNYPNPFNPETWIPFQLAEDADVVIRIYSSTGQIVRTFQLGQKSIGLYIEPSRAVYWDGCNEYGESVATGVYFYQIRAKDFTDMRRMVILR